jgi:hypothetical protein
VSHLAKALPRAAFAMLVAAAAANAQNPSPTPAPDQRPRHCGGTIYIGGQTANPFTAKRTTKATTILPDGTENSRSGLNFLLAIVMAVSESKDLASVNRAVTKKK